MKKFTGFRDVIEFWGERDPEGTAFIAGSAGSADNKVKISYGDFKRDVMARSRELLSAHLSDGIQCEIILCDGTYECL